MGEKKRFFQLLNLDTKGPIRTLRKCADYLYNSMCFPYNNGPLEGIIRKATTLTALAYGYRSFERFRNRFLLVVGPKIPLIERNLYYKKAS